MTIADSIRDDFPALRSGAVFFDAPGGTQMPEQVARRIYETAISPISNRGLYAAPARRADKVVQEFRAAMADMVGGVPEGIVHGRSATQLTFSFSQALSRDWSSGDNVVVTEMDHDSNITPWLLAAERTGAEVRRARVDVSSGELPVEQFRELIDENTRVVAVTAASNLIGTTPDIPAISALAHEAGALVYVDAVHYASHETLDVKALGADFCVYSTYKLFGPHMGILYADPALLETIQFDKLRPSMNQVPERFELGTLPYELLDGATEAVEYIASLASEGNTRRERIESAFQIFDKHELELRQRLEAGLKNIDGVTLYSRATNRTPTLLFDFDGFESTKISEALGDRDIVVPAGNFYASDLTQALGLGNVGALRVGFAPYNTGDDVDQLLEALEEIL